MVNLGGYPQPPPSVYCVFSVYCVSPGFPIPRKPSRHGGLSQIKKKKARQKGSEARQKGSEARQKGSESQTKRE